MAQNLIFDYLPNPNHYIKFGLNYVRHNFYPGSLAVVSQAHTKEIL